MGILKRFYWGRKKKLSAKILETEIFNLLNEAESLLDLYPEKGIQLLSQANGLYLWRGYDFKIECRINDVFLSYMAKYPSV